MKDLMTILLLMLEISMLGVIAAQIMKCIFLTSIPMMSLRAALTTSKSIKRKLMHRHH
jgi:hypothetical protein